MGSKVRLELLNLWIIWLLISPLPNPLPSLSHGNEICEFGTDSTPSTRSWTGGLPPGPGRSRWSAWSRGSHSFQSYVPQCNAMLDCTSCQILFLCTPQYPEKMKWITNKKSITNQSDHFNILSYLLNVVFLQSLCCTIHSILLHLLWHVSILDYGFAFWHLMWPATICRKQVLAPTKKYFSLRKVLL